jgi:hypothetical protein
MSEFRKISLENTLNKDDSSIGDIVLKMINWMESILNYR